MSRVVAFGNQLVLVHVELRERLEDLRDNLDAVLAGDRTADLRAHCAAFCGAVTRHHTAEDDTGFPVLAAHHPELAPVLAELVADHRIVADALTRLADVLADPDPATVRSEVETLSALLETHFTYEERKIVAVLDDLTTSAGPEDAAALAATTRLDD
ncbi:hemerythrin domain-containing protein [Actinosynnema sp. NPDC023587]|uniref:hemerythrin domain-containing protein n=1 Tax=Actinosynnema sp. NPDC023587 TaxID=3154695 RepID=UPI0033C729E0